MGQDVGHVRRSSSSQGVCSYWSSIWLMGSFYLKEVKKNAEEIRRTPGYQMVESS